MKINFRFYKPRYISNKFNKNKIKKLEKLCFRFSGILQIPSTDVIAWIEKPNIWNKLFLDESN